MPRRKKLPAIPDYTGIPRNEDDLLVQKSNPLQSLSETPLTLPELKILDVYLSRIDSHNPENRYVRFERGELEKLLGVTRLLKSELEKRLDNLFVAVTIRDENKPKIFTKIGLFAKAEATQDENGLWQVDLACTHEAMEYIFNIENLGYLRYRLKNIIDLTSRYSYVLYMYLENNRFRKTWEVDIDDLRKILNCTAISYNTYKEFNDKILKRCHKELTAKTTLQYTYTPCRKKGRKYTAIRFTVATVSDILATADELPASLESAPEDESQMVLDGYSGTGTYTYSNDNFALLAECSVNYAFDDTQISIIWDTLAPLPDNFFGEMSVSKSRIDYYISYVSRLYNKLVLAEKSKQAQNLPPIKNRFEYFMQMMDNDIKKRVSSSLPEPDGGGNDTTTADAYAGLSMFAD